MTTDDIDARAVHELTTLLRERICEALSGKISDKTIDAILDEELGPNNRA